MISTRELFRKSMRILNMLKFFHPNFRFTLELEQNNNLAFLDVLITQLMTIKWNPDFIVNKEIPIFIFNRNVHVSHLPTGKMRNYEIEYIKHLVQKVAI